MNIIWFFNFGLDCYDCLSLVVSLRFFIVYQVIVINVNGCWDQVSICIIVKKDILVYILMAFFLNGDGNNDWFMVYVGQGIIINICYMQIFNWWGEQVF